MAKPGMTALREACKPTIVTPTPTQQAPVQHATAAKKKPGIACGQ
jgi:hypothetical protein